MTRLPASQGRVAGPTSRVGPDATPPSPREHARQGVRRPAGPARRSSPRTRAGPLPAVQPSGTTRTGLPFGARTTQASASPDAKSDVPSPDRPVQASPPARVGGPRRPTGRRATVPRSGDGDPAGSRSSREGRRKGGRVAERRRVGAIPRGTCRLTPRREAGKIEHGRQGPCEAPGVRPRGRIGRQARDPARGERASARRGERAASRLPPRARTTRSSSTASVLRFSRRQNGLSGPAGSVALLRGSLRLPLYRAPCQRPLRLDAQPGRSASVRTLRPDAVCGLPPRVPSAGMAKRG